MSRSLRVTVFYGFHLSFCEDLDFNDVEELTTKFLESKGFKLHNYENGPAEKSYFDKFSKFKKEHLRVQTVYSGTEDYGDIYLAYNDSIKTTYDDFIKINIDGNTKQMQEDLKEFCNVVGVEYKEPEWLAVASYG